MQLRTAQDTRCKNTDIPNCPVISMHTGTHKYAHVHRQTHHTYPRRFKKKKPHIYTTKGRAMPCYTFNTKYTFKYSEVFRGYQLYKDYAFE